MEQSIRWGILGCGFIAGQFARGLVHAADAKCVAVGSRNIQKAEQFAKEHGVEHACNYETLVQRDDIDIIYIAAPHSEHMKLSQMCLEHGKAVLCEKPFAINEKQSQEMVDSAKAKNLFLMEAMWTRFLPGIQKLDELLKQEVIGKPQYLTADFGFKADYDPNNRLFDLSLGGGSLLDVGIYPIFLASFIFGKPTVIHGQANLGATGVDEQSGFSLQYAEGQIAHLFSSIKVDTPAQAVLCGSEGSITLVSPFWKCDTLILKRNGAKAETFKCPFEGNGYQFEAIAAGQALRQGKREHEWMRWEDTLANMKIMDTLRGQWNLSYPCEA